MNIIERDAIVIGIARRVFEEEAEGRSVSPDRLVWAAHVLDQRPSVLPPTPCATPGRARFSQEAEMPNDARNEREAHSQFIPQGCDQQGRLSPGWHPIETSPADLDDDRHRTSAGALFVVALAVIAIAAGWVLWRLA